MIKKILAFIYNEQTKKFLIVKTKGNAHEAHGKSQWFTITGNVEQGESNEEAVKREVKEETGLDIEEVYDLRWGSIYTWKGEECEETNYLAFVKEEKVVLNEEHDVYEWLSLKEFVTKIEWSLSKKELAGILERAISKEVHPLAYRRLDDCTKKDGVTRFINGDQVSLLTWHENNDFSKLKNVKQSSGVCLNRKGELLIIKTKEHWSLPGGTPEQGETFEQTLRREVDEEGDIDIDNIIPIGYNKIEQTKDEKKEVFYQLRYVANITKLKKQTIDPATGKIPERKFINPKDFLYYCPWGRQGEAMIKKAVRKRDV
ncbi:MAG TPA: NUDIX hydrolase [Candidatus Nanoarchaeia archaeon]|nr:NUDIX hydrolase [Candidatus Nanoarchaeia archaeon]